MHVVKEHNAEPETMEQFALAQRYVYKNLQMFYNIIIHYWIGGQYLTGIH